MMPNAEVHIVDGGHFALDTAADEIAALIGQFMKDAEMIYHSRGIGRSSGQGGKILWAKARTTGNSPWLSVNLLYAAIFLKFAGVPDGVTLFTQMSQRFTVGYRSRYSG